MTKIVIDAMGGDNAPKVIIEGALDAISEYPDFHAILVGNVNELSPFIEQYSLNSNDRLSVVHAESIIGMSDSSVSSVRDKKDSSITVAMGILKDGGADALVSIGHTGAMVTAAIVRLRMLFNIDRPCLAVVLPTRNNGNVILADVGATVDCNRKQLMQFSIMTDVYHRVLFGCESSPRIGLLSIGDEDVKGNLMVKSAFDGLSKLPINFIGNVEGNEIFSGNVDIVLCDGFVGNVILKVIEGLTTFAISTFKEAFMKNIFRMIVGKLTKDIVDEIYTISDIERYGGAPLLGVNGICIKGHGRSTSRSVKYTIGTTLKFVEKKINQSITDRISNINFDL